MANAEQVQQLIDIMKEQMETMKNLQAENARLSNVEAATTVERVTAATPANNEVNSSYKPKKPDRPVINPGMDDREWALFTDTWTRYKIMANVPANDVAATRLELWAACSGEVNQLLFEYVGKDT